ncbi:hypothetical protein D3C76_1689340 [compost metagenome]
MIAVDEAIPHLPAHTVSAEKTVAAIQGQRLSYKSVSPEVIGENPIRLYDPEHRFLGIFQRQQETGAIAPIKVFL